MTQNERHLTWLSGLKEELFEALSKFKILMFFDERTLSVSLLIFFLCLLY
jgi:hypothetical protein